MGFSAGGHVCADLLTRFAFPAYAPVDAADRLSARPDAAAPIYPVISMTRAARPCRLAPQSDRRECDARRWSAPIRRISTCRPTRRPASCSTPRTTPRFPSATPCCCARRCARATSRSKPTSSRTAATASACASPAAIPSNIGPICSSPGPQDKDLVMIARLLALLLLLVPAAAGAQSRDEIERHDAPRDHLHGRAGRDQWRLCLGLSARHVAPLGRDRGAAEHDLGPAAGHRDDGPSLPRRLSRHRRRILLPRRRRPRPAR